MCGVVQEVAQGGDDAGWFEGWLGSAPVGGAVDQPGRDRGQAAGLGVEDRLPSVRGLAFEVPGSRAVVIPASPGKRSWTAH